MQIRCVVAGGLGENLAFTVSVGAQTGTLTQVFFFFNTLEPRALLLMCYSRT